MFNKLKYLEEQSFHKYHTKIISNMNEDQLNKYYTSLLQGNNKVINSITISIYGVDKKSILINCILDAKKKFSEKKSEKEIIVEETPIKGKTVEEIFSEFGPDLDLDR